MALRKCMDGDYECSEEGSVRTEQGDFMEAYTTAPDTPWYLRGPKSVYVDYYAISEQDCSTESEIDEGDDEDQESSDDEDIDDEEDEEGEKTKVEPVATEAPEDMEEGASELTLKESEAIDPEPEPEKKEEPSDADMKALTQEESETHKGESSTQGDYWQIRKLMKYIKGGDESTTVVATSIVGEHDLTLEGHKNAIIDTGGLEIFLNLLTVQNLKCVQAALKVLKQMVIMPDVSSELVELGIIGDLWALLKHSEDDVLSDTVCILADLSESQLKVRTIARKIGVLPHLVDLVDKIPRNTLIDNVNNLNGSPMVRMEIALDAMRALAALSRSLGVRMVLYKCGILHMLPSLLLCKEEDLKNNALLIIMYCASIPIFRKSFEAHNVLKLVVSCWKDQTKDEVILRIIYKMAISDEGRSQAIKCKVMKKIISLMRDEKIFSKFNILKYCLASIYRLGVDPKVSDSLQELDLIPFLVKNLSHDDEGLAVYASGVLSYISSNPANWKKIKEAGCTSVLIKIIEGKMNTALLANVDQVIGDLCNDKSMLAEFCAKDAIRHIWSHLAYDSVDLQKAASRALVPLLDIEDSGEEVRNLSGSMDLLIELLDSKDDMVKSSSCEALAKVSKDPENLNILMEMNIVQKINQLITTLNSNLKRSLCLLIAGVAEHPQGCYEIGRSQAIEHLVVFLIRRFPKLADDVKSAAASALWKLSQEPVNAANLFNTGVVPLLIDCLREGHPSVREPAEGCLFNIRSLAHDVEEISFFGSLKPGKSVLEGRQAPVEYVSKFFKEPTLDDV